MKPCDWFEQIALLAGGDLDAPQAAAVERHLAECTTCTELFVGLERDRELLREAPEIAGPLYVEVREAVLHRVRAGRQSWKFGAAAAAILAVAAGVSWYRYELRKPLAEIAISVPAPAAPPVAAKGGRREPPRIAPNPRDSSAELAMALREALGPEIAAPVANDAPLVMAALTDDPDVVIILVPQTKGDNNE